MKEDLLIITLSVNPQILDSKFVKTYDHVYDEMTSSDYLPRCVVFVQGFDRPSSKTIDFVRDDTMIRHPISEVREYFTNKALEMYPDCKYILFTDDDFKFRKDSGKDIVDNLSYLDSHPGVGLINFKMTNEDCSSPEVYEDANPSFIYMRGGILVRKEAYRGWSFSPKLPYCTYYEESILASKIYEAGYRVMTSSTHTVHRTSRKGLGKSIEQEYEGREEELLTGGRQQLEEVNWFTPSLKDGKPNYRTPCKMTNNLRNSHLLRLKDDIFNPVITC